MAKSNGNGSNGHGNGNGGHKSEPAEESLPTRIARKLISLARLDPTAVAGVTEFSGFVPRHILHALAKKEIADTRPETYGLVIALQGQRGTPIGEVLGELEIDSKVTGLGLLREVAALSVVVRVYDLLVFEAKHATTTQPAEEEAKVVAAQPAEEAKAAAQPAA